MDANYYKKYEPIFGAWYIAEKIGEGSFGQVYIIERRELGVTYRAALKAITIPQNQSEKESMVMDGMSKEDITRYYRGIVRDIANEFTLMAKLKGTSNIVSYEDHVLIEHEDGIGWDILIRMELLTPLYTHISNIRLTMRDIINFGIDMCNALELCEKNNIIHRDIKPENIFISSNGDYKLGDFGVARTMEESVSGLSKKGTYMYMAPEVYRGEKYGHTVDICSLGIVMYKLLNNNRAPFMPPYPNPITYTEKKEALEKRITGEKIPAPQNGSKELNDIVLKACEYDPNDRYQTAEEMKTALQSLISGINQKQEQEKSVKMGNKEQTDKSENNSSIRRQEKPIHGADFRKRIAVIVVAAVMLLIAAAVYALIPKAVTDIQGLNEETVIYIGDTLSPEYKIEPDKFEDTKITFKVGDENIISVDEDGNITGKKVGESTLLLSAQNYEEEAVIKVKAKVMKISNVDKTINITEGESKEIHPELSPEKFNDEKITYEIKDSKIATVTQAGKIKGIRPGRTTLVISAGGCIKTVTVEVTEYVVPVTTYDYTPSYNYNTNSSGGSSGSSRSSGSSGGSDSSNDSSGSGEVIANPDAEIVDEDDW